MNESATVDLTPPFRITLSAVIRRLFHPFNPLHWHRYFWALEYSNWIQSLLYRPGEPTPQDIARSLRQTTAFQKAIRRFEAAIERETRNPIPDQPYSIPFGRGLDLNECPHCGSQSMMGMSDWEFHHSELPSTTSRCIHCNATVHFQREARTIVDVSALVQPQGYQFSSKYNISCSHHEIGLLYRISGDLGKSMEHYEKAREIMADLEGIGRFRKREVSNTLGIMHFRIGEVHQLRGSSDKARGHYASAESLMNAECEARTQLNAAKEKL